MNYRHDYHAGNFADVLKHTVLMLCLEHLKRKASPFSVVDTHAGAGRYRLDTAMATATSEWRGGIGRLLGPSVQPLPEPASTILQPYLAAVRRENAPPVAPDEVLFYPGSPLLIQTALRQGDTMVVSELHPETAAVLRSVLGTDAQCTIGVRDGYAALKALLPPVERRGLILIDPPFEMPGEFAAMTDALAEGLRRFATGIYVLWYPIKDVKAVARFHRGVRTVVETAGVPPPLHAELLLRPARNPFILNGSGVIVVNPPFTLAEQMAQALPILAARLGDLGKGTFRIGLAPTEDIARRAPPKQLASKTHKATRHKSQARRSDT